MAHTTHLASFGPVFDAAGHSKPPVMACNAYHCQHLPPPPLLQLLHLEVLVVVGFMVIARVMVVVRPKTQTTCLVSFGPIFVLAVEVVVIIKAR